MDSIEDIDVCRVVWMVVLSTAWTDCMRCGVRVNNGNPVCVKCSEELEICRLCTSLLYFDAAVAEKLQEEKPWSEELDLVAKLTATSTRTAVLNALRD